MKHHITDKEFIALNEIVRDWADSKVVQEACLQAMVKHFDCDEHEAMGILNEHCTARGVVESHSIEVHNASCCQLPWRMDRESGLVALFIVGSSIAVHVAAMLS